MKKAVIFITARPLTWVCQRSEAARHMPCCLYLFHLYSFVLNCIHLRIKRYEHINIVYVHLIPYFSPP